MAIETSGLYLATFVDQFDVTQLGLDYITDTVNAALVLDAATVNAAALSDTTPYFTAGGTEKDNEASGSGYSAGGSALAGKSLADNSQVMEWNATDHVWGTSSIANAMACVIYDSTEANNNMFCILDFVTAVTSDGGDFTVDFPANGFIRIPAV